MHVTARTRISAPAVLVKPGSQTSVARMAGALYYSTCICQQHDRLPAMGLQRFETEGHGFRCERLAIVLFCDHSRSLPCLQTSLSRVVRGKLCTEIVSLRTFEYYIVLPTHAHVLFPDFAPLLALTC